MLYSRLNYAELRLGTVLNVHRALADGPLCPEHQVGERPFSAGWNRQVHKKLGQVYGPAGGNQHSLSEERAFA